MQHALDSAENRNKNEIDDDNYYYSNTGDTIYDKKLFGLFFGVFLMVCFYHIMYR